MRMLVACLAGCLCLFLESITFAQGSDLPLPGTRITIGLGEINKEGQLRLTFDSKNAIQVPVVENVELPYTVHVPYVETTERNGKTVRVTKTRAETRNRTVVQTRMESRTEMAFAFKSLQFFSVANEEVSQAQAREYFASKKPIVVVENGSEINEFFAQIFSDDVLVVQLPKLPQEPR